MITRQFQMMVTAVVASLCVSMVSADDQPYEWKVGLATVKITQAEPLRMAGYGSIQRGPTRRWLWLRGIYSGGIGIFSPDAERVVAQKVQALATKAGRPDVKIQSQQ